MYSSKIDELKNIYQDFPYYDEISISVHKHRKSRFRGVYIESNFANPNTGDSLINYISDNFKEDDRKEIPIKEIREYNQRIINHLKSESYTELFNKIWSIEEYKNIGDNEYIQTSNDFILNLEITILSYLQLGAIFPQYGLAGEVDFNEMLEAKTFEDKLDEFLKLYIISIDKVMYLNLIKNSGEIKIDDYEDYIDIIKKNKILKTRGIDYTQIKELITKNIKEFATIKKFYSLIKKLIGTEQVKIIDGAIHLNVREDLKNFNIILEEYKNVVDAISHIPIETTLLDFKPNKTLSSGEKSLLEFYASIYHYIENKKNKKHQHFERYLLLLDEPELGYHPFWKKKFITAITKTLPLLFSEIQPQKYNKATKKYESANLKTPELQIIFSTHDPLTLSDIPNHNVVYLDFDKINQHSKMLSYEDVKPTKTFGANISDLLADSFFVNDGLIGDFAKEKIEGLIIELNLFVESKNENQVIDVPKEKQYRIWKTISTIDEPIIKNKLIEMYNFVFDIAIANEIQELEERIKYLRKLKENRDD